MTRCSIKPKDGIFIKSYRLFPLTKNMNKNIGNHLSKHVSSKYIQKLLDHAKQSATDALKTTSKRLIQKTAE